MKVTKQELTTALKLLDSNPTAWHKEKNSLRHPVTGKKVSRQAIYRAIDENGPDWIIKEIQSKIAEARKKFPEYYMKKRQQ